MNDDVRAAYGTRLKPGFLPACRLFRSSVGISPVLADVVPKTVTLRKDLTRVFTHDVPHPRTQTPFMEVDIVPFEEAMPDEVLSFVANPPVTDKCGKLARRLGRLFLKVVEQAWDPKKFHLIWHSSGHDSRLISWAIKYLYEKNGPDWLGDILFIEWDCEAEPFKQIMETEGWSPTQYAVYKPTQAGTLEYHADSVEFTHAWERLNGHVSIPLSYWCDPVIYFQQQGLIPGDDQLQCWNGQFANETVKWTELYGSLEVAIRKITDNLLCTTTQKGDFVWPYLNLEWITTKRRYATSFGWHQKWLVEELAPELTCIPRVDGSVLKRSSCRRISRPLLAQAKRDFYGSWYASNAPLIPPVICTPVLTYCSWWGHWALASLCEHLIEQGHTIKT